MTVTTNGAVTGLISASESAWLTSSVSGAGVTGSQNTMVCLGDSLTDRAAAVSGSSVIGQSTSFLLWANAFSGDKLRIVEAGVSGDTTAQMLARYSTDVAPYPGAWLHLLGGINDVGGDVAYTTTIANIAAIVTLARAEGRRLIIGTFYPTGTTTTAVRRRALHQINNYIRSLRSEYIRVADYYSAMVDSAGVIRTSVLVADAIHPSAYGASLMGRVLADQVSDFPVVLRLASSNFDGSNGAPCGAMNGNNASGSNNYTAGTGFTGNGPRGWAWSRTGAGITATVSKQARSTNAYGGADFARAVISVTGADYDVARLERSVAYRLWSSGGTANSVRRFYVPSTGAHYDVVSDGAFAAGADPTASWSTTPGEIFTDGTATLMCIDPIAFGRYFDIAAECNISSVSVGTVCPTVNMSLMTPAFSVLAVATAMQHDSGNAPAPASGETTAGLVLHSPRCAVPATWDTELALTSTSSGPIVRIRCELAVVGSALATVDWGRVTARHYPA